MKNQVIFHEKKEKKFFSFETLFPSKTDESKID